MIFDIRFEVEYFNLHPSFFASPTIQSFDIRFDDESLSEREFAGI